MRVAVNNKSDKFYVLILFERLNLHRITRNMWILKLNQLDLDSNTRIYVRQFWLNHSFLRIQTTSGYHDIRVDYTSHS